MAAYRERLKRFGNVVNSDVIDMRKLRDLCMHGCPHESGYRAISWKLLLDYLPPQRSEWSRELTTRRKTYKTFIYEMIIQPGSSTPDSGPEGAIEDHPLNPNPESQWVTYFKDNEMLLQIDKDCRRLCPDLNFFQQATDFPCKHVTELESGIETLRKRVENTVLKSHSVSKNWTGATSLIKSSRKSSFNEHTVLCDGQEAHWEVVERMLFIYAKLNPGLAYVQGMNEIIGPIYYTFASNPNVDWREHAEADSFFCFTNVMAEIRDNFIKTLDDSDMGIGAMMNKLMHMVKSKDVRLAAHLKEIDMKPQFFAFRWLTLMLSQELPLPDLLRVWDSLFSDEKRFHFLICVCCAMILLIRDEMLKSDFSVNMKLLQNYPLTDIHSVLSKALEISR